MSKPLCIIFMGTPDFSVQALKALISSRHKVVCVYSQPPRPKGRGQQVQKSPVHLAAEKAGIEVRHPPHFKNEEDVAAFAALKSDVAVVAAYGLIVPQSVLDAPKYGCINIHASLLPRWRGAAPIHRAILEGDQESGVSIMQMDAGLDTGPVIAVDKVAIDNATTSSSLHDSLSSMGARLIVRVMDDLSQNGYVTKTPQPDTGVTYASRLKKEEGHINWSNPACIIDRKIRALDPWPSTFIFNKNKDRLKILSAVCVKEEYKAEPGTLLNDDGIIVCGDARALKILSVQPESKKPMSMAQALQGGYIHVGEVFQ